MAQTWKCYVGGSTFRQGWQEAMSSQDMQAGLKEAADQIVARCGQGYADKAYKGKYKAVAIVYPETAEAYYDNVRHNTLLKAGEV